MSRHGVNRDELSPGAKKLIELCGECQDDIEGKMSVTEALKKYPKLIDAADEYMKHREKCGISIKREDTIQLTKHSLSEKIKLLKEKE